MAHTTRTVTLSLALLLASTSLSQAGFIWLAPDNQPASSGDTVYSQQAPVEEQAPANTDNRAWTVDPSVPVAGATPPVIESAPAQVLVPPADAAAAPVELSTAPAVTETQPTAAATPAPVTAPIVLNNQTMATQPVYAPGDQPPSAVVSAPVDLATAAPVQAPAAEVTLATSQDIPSVAPTSTTGPATNSMPNAQAMIDSMPSMTTPRAPAAAPAPAPTQAEVTLATTAPATTPAPATMAAAPVTAPVTAPVEQAAAPAGVSVSPITGETVPLAAYVPPAVTSNQVVEGFGKSVPLVIAMRQILPSEYSFAHSEGVDLSQSVSWEGGKPWPEVLDGAIGPLGLTANLTGDTVMLSKKPVEMAPELQAPAIVAPAVTSRPAPGAAAVLTNATIMQSPPSN